MDTIDKMDETLASLERVARMAIAATRDALGLPQNAPIWEEIRATSDAAIELLAFAEVGQWASAEPEKRAALDRATEIARKLYDSTNWMRIPIADLAFLHEAPRKQ